MLSLEDRISLLERDLTSSPLRISVYNDLPFAILRYAPNEEWKTRLEARRLATRLSNSGKAVHFISLADLLWEVIAAAEGIEAVAELEQERGFEEAQQQVATYLSNGEYWPSLPDLLAEKLSALDPDHDIAFLMHASAMAPAIYQMSKLLDQMQGRTLVPAVLFYPGTLEGATGLRFMALKEREALGNYRVKIYD